MRLLLLFLATLLCGCANSTKEQLKALKIELECKVESIEQRDIPYTYQVRLGTREGIKHILKINYICKDGVKFYEELSQ